MKRISLFETTDGQKFADKDAAKLHEGKITFEKQIKEQFWPIIKAAPDSQRILIAMMEEPEVFLTALTTYSKLRKKLHKSVPTE